MLVEQVDYEGVGMIQFLIVIITLFALDAYFILLVLIMKSA